MTGQQVEAPRIIYQEAVIITEEQLVEEILNLVLLLIVKIKTLVIKRIDGSHPSVLYFDVLNQTIKCFL